jgi:hypothetical protein
MSFWVTRDDTVHTDELSWNGVERAGEDLCLTRHYAGDRLRPRMIDGLMVWENRRVLPRAFVVRQALVTPDSVALFDTVSRASGSLRDLCLLEHDVTGIERMDALAPPAEVSVETYRSDEVVFAVRENLSPGILVASETWYPGWRVEIDGREAPLLRTNFAFRGVFLEAGDHRVRFHYAPRSFRTGLGASAMGLVLATALLAWPRRGRSRDR